MIRSNPGRLIWAICLVAFLGTAAASFLAFERLPHLEDEVAYLFQARTLAMGRLTVPSPSQPDSFWIPFVLDYQGQRFGKYPPGWPLVLALGVLAGQPWLVNPALAAVCLYLTFRLGKTLFDERTGLVAAALGLMSPLVVVLGGSFLSHLCTMAALLLFSLWFAWAAQGRGRGVALGAGLALGFAFLSRPLTAVAYAAPFVLYSLVRVIGRRQPHWHHTLWVAAGGAVSAALLPIYQWAVTGDPWLNPYVLWWPYDRIGFGPGVGAMPGGHSLHWAGVNLRQDLSRAATDLLGWPGLSWLPLVLGLALRPRRLRDWGLLAPFGCLVVAYLFYWIGSPARLWGPRYYVEGFAGLWLLAGAGLVKAWSWAETKNKLAGHALVAVTVTLCAAGLALNLPSRMQEAHGFYGISRAQLEPVAEAGLHNALVIVYADRWLEYGAMLAGMSPTLDDDVIYARGRGPEADAAVMAEHAGRSIYYLERGRLSATRPEASPPP